MLFSWSRLGLRVWGNWAAASTHASNESGAIFWCHLFPTLGHAISPFAALAAAGPVEPAPSAEEKPREAQESDGLPESDGGQLEESGHQPVPQVKDGLAEAKGRDDEKNYDENYEFDDFVNYSMNSPMNYLFAPLSVHLALLIGG
jgi:hypothetical protein